MITMPCAVGLYIFIVCRVESMLHFSNCSTLWLCGGEVTGDTNGGAALNTLQALCH